ncbi:TadE/TadG family type IV pilus assembly protein [Salinarimonas soli]|nr:TadE/TadG family type IV pilus assembly protein [Salinarimonas soli]
MTRPHRSFARDEAGATMVEFGLVAGVLFTLAFALFEFSHAFFQYNAASKALQIGARRASVSDPVAADLRTLTGLSTAEAGDPMPYFERRCSGATRSCSQGTFDEAAFNTILYGGPTATCLAGTSATTPMCAAFPRLQPGNVEIDYVHSGLGFAGRPGPAGRAGGAVPTITVRLTNLAFDFVVLNRLLGLPSLAMSGLSATATGEDLASVTN